MDDKKAPETEQPGTAFSVRLRKLMDERNLRPASLARAVGMSHVAMKNYLEGRVPDTRSLYQLSRYFGVSMEYLLRGESASPDGGTGRAPESFKEGLLALMNYELRAPLNGVLGYLDLLSMTSLTKEQREHVRMISTSGDALLRKLNDILDLVASTPPGETEDGVAQLASFSSFHFRTLVIEDNSTARHLLVKMLKTLGIEPDEAASGTEGIEMHSASPYEIIFMDVRLPGMDGIEVTRRIREIEGSNSQLPPAHIVATTAQAMPEDRRKCLSAGMNDYLSKPMRRRDIMRVLSSSPRPKDS